MNAGVWLVPKKDEKGGNNTINCIEVRMKDDQAKNEDIFCEPQQSV